MQQGSPIPFRIPTNRDWWLLAGLPSLLASSHAVVWIVDAMTRSHRIKFDRLFWCNRLVNRIQCDARCVSLWITIDVRNEYDQYDRQHQLHSSLQMLYMLIASDMFAIDGHCDADDESSVASKLANGKHCLLVLLSCKSPSCIAQQLVESSSDDQWWWWWWWWWDLRWSAMIIK